MITNDTLHLMNEEDGRLRLITYALGTMAAHSRAQGFEIPKDCPIVQSFEFWTGFCDTAMRITTRGLKRVTMDASHEAMYAFGVFVRSMNVHLREVDDDELYRVFGRAGNDCRLDLRGKMAKFVIQAVYQPGVVYERRRQIEVEGMRND